MTDERDRGIVRERYVSLSHDGHVASKWCLPFVLPTMNVHISVSLQISSFTARTLGYESLRFSYS